MVPYTDSSQPEVKLELEVPSTSLKQENAASSSPKTSVPKAVKVENISTDNTQLPVHGPLLPSQHPQPSEDYPQMVADSVISRLPESTVESSAMIGPQLPPAAPSQPESSANVTVIGPELPSSSSHVDKPANGGKDKSDDSDSLFGDDMDVDEYIHRKLEEPVFNKYESVKQKIEVPQPETGDEKPAKDEVSDDLDIVSDDLDIDVDTIDRELEKALERKKVVWNWARQCAVTPAVLHMLPSRVAPRLNDSFQCSMPRFFGCAKHYLSYFIILVGVK